MRLLFLKNCFFCCLFIYFFLCTVTVFAQEEVPIKIIKTDHSYTEWYKESQKEKPNYYKVKQLYDDFFKEHFNEKSPQKSLLYRWFQVNKNYLDAEGNVVIDSPPVEETVQLMRLNQPQNNARRAVVSTSPYPAWNDMTGSWRMIGPYHNKNKGCSNYPMSGGFNDRVYINPYNTQNLFSGQSYGGLWVSKDQGATWKLTDATFPNGKNTYANRDIYYGDIKASKTNQNLIFAATEAGVLKSTDAGDTWTLVNDLNYTSRSTERAYYLALSNHDGDMLLATYGKKVYRTTDGGSTWTMVFDNSAGGSNYSQGQHGTTGVSQRKYNIVGLAFHPTSDNVVYLAVRNSSNQVVVHRSQDHGQTWSALVNTQNTNTLKMEVVPSAPNRIYFFELYANLGEAQTRNGILKYDESGTLVQALKYPVIGHLLDDCTVSPTDSTVMYLGGYASGEVHKSTDGGLTFTTNNPGYNNTTCGKYVHPDVRCISVVGDVVLVASDGGNSISTDAMATVYNTGQWISGIDLWGFSSSFKGDVIGAGDDHGPTEMRWFDGDGGWEHDGGADSKDITINPVQPRWVYAMDIYRKYRMVTKDAAYDKSYTIPNTSISSLKYLAVNPNLYAVSYPVKDAYLMVSKDNMASIAETLYTFSANITRVKQALRNPNIFYVLVDVKDVYKSTDGGHNFTKITPSTTVTGGITNITDIEVSQDGSVVWLSYGQVQNTCKAVKSTDGGATWVNYTATGLPSQAASNITMQRGTIGGVYLTTNGGGVWYRDNTMSVWSLLGTGLPMLGYVTSTYVVPNKKAFRMGTSRGAFEHPLAFTTSADALIAVDKNTATTCRDTLFFRDFSAYEGTTNIQYAWTFEGGTPATSTEENPKVLYANAGTYDVTLTVTDANNNVSTHTLNDFITITAGTCTPETVRGKSLKITAQNSYMRAPNASITNTNTYTLMAWVKGTGTQADYAGILSAKTSAATDPNVHLNVRGANADSAEIGYHHPNGQWYYSSGLYLKPNTWTHIALVVNPTSISIVKDGVRATHTGRNVVATNFIENLTVGTMAGAEWYRTFVGEIDEVAVYKRALTDDEIRSTMHLTKNNPQYPAQSDADLVAYYQFNEEGTTTPIYDRIGIKDGAFIGGNVSRVTSTGPFSGGVSETIPAVTSGGNKAFATAGLTLKFPATGTYPGGAITAYRLDEKPYLPQPDTILNKYWIVRNWGAAKRFSALDSITFVGATLNPAYLSNFENYHFQARPQNSYTSDWFVNTIKAKAAQGAPTNKVRFAGSSITLFGQYILSETEEPCVSLAVTAAITSNNGNVCTGSSAIFTITGTKNATVTYNINGGNSTTVTLTNGVGTVTIPGVTANQTLNLVSVSIGSCSQNLTGSSTVTVTPVTVGGIIVYNGSPYCSNGGTATVTRTGNATGIFSTDVAGLSLNSTTGAVNLAASTPGTYLVKFTYNTPCASGITTTYITINAAPTATITYSSTPYCSNAGTATVTRTGKTGGVYSSTAGLSINATTGTIDLATSTAGSYVVTYTIAASNGCAEFKTTTNVTITAAPTATITYTANPFCSNAGTATVTRTGNAGGAYSSTSGLSINSTTGVIDLSASTAGSYVVTYTIAAANGCAEFKTTTNVTITAAPTATITYTANPFCSNAGTATVTRTGSTDGVYSSTAGLSINSTTGSIDLSASIAGSYVVTYTIAAANGCAEFKTTTNVTITAAPTATIAYSLTPYCKNSGTATITRTGTAGGVYSSTAGLSINSTTGAIDLATSTAGSYVVTYTIVAANGCAEFKTTTNVTITAAPTATITYTANPFCSNAGTATVTRTGNAGGAYSSTSGLSINSTTGAIDLATSTAGSYVVTYTIVASNGCAEFKTTTNVTITAAPTATITYMASPFCSNAGTATVTRTGSAGGVYSSTAGLSINSTTGAIDLATSTAVSYVVTYTIAAANGCADFKTTTNVTITAAPTATIAYSSTPYCSNAGTATVTRTGSAGGVYSSTAGLSINSTTGAIDLAASTAGNYVVTYTIAAANGCAEFKTATNVTITAAPTATITYSSTPYCSKAGTVTVTRTGSAGGVYSSTVGLSINSTTGAIDLAASTAGSYVVTYTIAAANGCAEFKTTTNVTITASPTAIITYSSTPYCKNSGTATVTRTGSAGGVYSSTSGLSINSTTGAIDLSASTAGSYVVTYTIAAANGCAEFKTTTNVTITAAPTATITYTASPFCSNAGTATVTRTGSAGGVYSSTAGLSINSTTGVIDLAASTAGSYVVTYTIAAANGCAEFKTTANVTVQAVLPTPTISSSQSASVCMGTEVLLSTNCPLGSTVLWSNNSKATILALNANTPGEQTVTAKCQQAGFCESAISTSYTVKWNSTFSLTLINIGQSRSAIKQDNAPKSAWASQFVTPDAGPSLENSTQNNPTIYHAENTNKTAPRYWTIHAETCNLGTEGSLTFNMLSMPESGVERSYNTHENNAPYFMYANRAGFTELYAQNHPAYGFYEDNGNGGNVYDIGLPKGLYKLGVRYWSQKGQGSIYPSTRQPAGNVLAYQEFWFRIQSKDGVGVGTSRVASDNEQRITDNGHFVEVAPNPFSKTLQLKVADAKGQQVNVSLVDASGRTLLQRGFTPETNKHQEEFDMKAIPNGMYFLRVSAGDKQATLKVVKMQ